MTMSTQKETEVAVEEKNDPPDAVLKANKNKNKTTTASSLVPSKVYVRIRPMVYDGSGHDQDGQALAKSLESYSDTSITLQTQYMFSKGSNEYTFPTQVFTPEATQTQVYDNVVPALVEQVVHRNDAMLLSYGQTGTGKTVTIFGFEQSLKRQYNYREDVREDIQMEIDPDWGILPRLTLELFDKLNKARNNNQKGTFVVAISAIEFYLAMIVDLLHDDDDTNDTTTEPDDNTVRMDGQNKPAGYKRVVLESPWDIFAIIEKIMARRSSRATNMNHTTADGHAGSSRSHCAIIFTILQTTTNDNSNGNDPPTTTFRQTQFHLVDLAGAERPSKVGTGSAEEVQGCGIMAAYKLYKGEPITAQEEGLLINYELFEFCKEIKMATALHKKSKPYSPPRQLGTNLTKYLCRCVDGRALLAMIVCISQAPQCGWETWFSMKYGTDLSELCTPTMQQQAKPFNLQKALHRCEDLRQKARQALAAHEKQHAGSSHPNAKKWLGHKRTDLREAEERLRLLRVLQERVQTNHSNPC